MADARFADGNEAPLHLAAADGDDLRVLSALMQDAVLTVADVAFDRPARRLVMLVNRFRWEDCDAAARAGRPPERVRAMLLINDAMAVRSDGIDKTDRDLVLSLLTMDWEPADDGMGRLMLTFSGDGLLVVDAECINLELRDVTRPYAAPSGKAPAHPQ